MARLARVVIPGYPHHVTQRGNRRLPTFISDEDYPAYLALVAEPCAARGVAIWAWCLMPNHVHLVAEVSPWRRFLETEEDEATVEGLRRHGRTGRPWGDEAFLRRLEGRLGRALVPGKPGRPRKRDKK